MPINLHSELFTSESADETDTYLVSLFLCTVEQSDNIYLMLMFIAETVGDLRKCPLSRLFLYTMNIALEKQCARPVAVHARFSNSHYIYMVFNILDFGEVSP